MKSSRFAVVLSGLLIAGCASDAKDEVVRTWGENIADLGISPVYPPNALLAPGQVAIVPQVSKKHAYATQAIVIGYIDLRSELRENAGRAIILPDTTEQEPSKAIWKRSVDPKGESIYDPPTLNHVGGFAPLVVFPTFEIAKGGEGSLSAYIPFSWISAAFGGKYGSDTQISVSIPAAEMVGTDLIEAVKAYEEACRGDFASNHHLDDTIIPVESLNFCDPGHISESFWTGFSDVKKPRGWRLRIIYQVYYARSIKFHFAKGRYAAVAAQFQAIARTSLNTQQSLANAATQGGVAQAPPGGGAPVVAPAPVPAPPPAADASPFTAISNNAAAASKAAQLELASGLGGTSPGGSFQISGYSADGVDVDEVFQQPVAIGYRALTLPIGYLGAMKNEQDHPGRHDRRKRHRYAY